MRHGPTEGESGGVGHAAYERRAWAEAHAELAAADGAGRLDAVELERFAIVAELTGAHDDGAALWERAHRAWLDDGDAPAAARCAFWLAFRFMDRGEMARASGWLARAQRLLDSTGEDCAARGYVLIPTALGDLESGSPARALERFEEVAACGDRFADTDLATLGRLGRGQALIRLGETAEGATQLDEVMVSVVAGELSPIPSGIVYCAVIEACQEMFDLRRAQEWTTALSEWCDSQPDLVPFRGRCLVYRAEIMQIRGAWQDAASEAQRAFERLSEPRPQPAVGAVFYCQAELHRLRGALADAEDAYRHAEEWGHRAEPGRALLRLAQGRLDAASVAIRHALDEATEPVARAPLLAASVEIMLGAGDTISASTAARELATIAGAVQSLLLDAVSLRASAMVSLARGDPEAAADGLRSALAHWRTLDAPYEAARTRVLLARSVEDLGDRDAAAAELAAARGAFERLGATLELRRLGTEPTASRSDPSGLTPREREVLALVATGMTNRSIAANLTISEKTVARHLSNIFGKLGVTSRAAATAYAYEHQLV